MSLNRREAKAAAKAAKDSKESVAQQQLVCDEDTEESCCVYTRRSSPFNFGGWWEEVDGTDGTKWCLDEDFCVFCCIGRSLSGLCIATFITVPFNSFNKAYPEG